MKYKTFEEYVPTELQKMELQKMAERLCMTVLQNGQNYDELDWYERINTWRIDLKRIWWLNEHLAELSELLWSNCTEPKLLQIQHKENMLGTPMFILGPENLCSPKGMKGQLIYEIRFTLEAEAELIHGNLSPEEKVEQKRAIADYYLRRYRAHSYTLQCYGVNLQIDKVTSRCIWREHGLTEEFDCNAWDFYQRFGKRFWDVIHTKKPLFVEFPKFS